MSPFPLPAADLLPHRPPMLCIDLLLHASAHEAEASADLFPGHLLLHKGRLHESGFIELAAQTAGAMKGYNEKIKGRPVRDGFLAAVRKFSCPGIAGEGDTLRIAVKLVAEMGGVSLLEAGISRDAAGCREILAHGTLKVFIVQEQENGEEA
jgi:predicted hotdog family 3-hydroxylacyl-ACP dehydratase